MANLLENSFCVVIHGGSFVYLVGQERVTLLEESLTRIIRSIHQYVTSNLSNPEFSSVDVVEYAVKLLEDDPLYNAGKGSVFTSEQTHVLEASIMDGSNLQIGAVSQLEHYKNPISVARVILEQSHHNYLVGKYAENFVENFMEKYHLEQVENNYFSTERRLEQLNVQREEQIIANLEALEGMKKGTVGCVVMLRGQVAAGTSTGGMTGKNPGRIGDSPIIGAGTYANNQTAALSLTGTGEEIMRYLGSGDIISRMKYGQQTLTQAVEGLLFTTMPPDTAGVIGVTIQGDYTMRYNSKGMLRAMCSSKDMNHAIIGIYEEEQPVSLV
jgi:L-asparaginase / beta-aspartyl-peptidase